MGRAKGQSAVIAQSSDVRRREVSASNAALVLGKNFLLEQDEPQASALLSSLAESGYTQEFALHVALYRVARSRMKEGEGEFYAYYTTMLREIGIGTPDPQRMLQDEVSKIQMRLGAKAELSASLHVRQVTQVFRERLGELFKQDDVPSLASDLLIASGLIHQSHDVAQYDTTIDTAKDIVNKATGEDLAATPVAMIDMKVLECLGEKVSEAFGVYFYNAKTVVFNSAAKLDEYKTLNVLVHELIHSRQDNTVMAPTRNMQRSFMRQVLLEGSTTVYADVLMSKRQDFTPELSYYAVDTALVHGLTRVALTKGHVKSHSDAIKKLALCSDAEREMIATEMLFGVAGKAKRKQLQQVVFRFIFDNAPKDRNCVDDMNEYEQLVSKAYAALAAVVA